MKYSSYCIKDNEDGTVTAFEIDRDDELTTASNEDGLDLLMAKLDKAYCEGVVDGIKENKQDIRRKLGL